MNSFSFIIPGRNEANGIIKTLEGLIRICNQKNYDYELLFINDGSTDSSLKLATDFKTNNPIIPLVIINNPVNIGLANSYYKALSVASKTFCIYVTADNNDIPSEILKILEIAGSADIIIPYFSNFNDRNFLRRLISKTYTNIINFLINNLISNDINYFNANTLHKTENIKKLKQLNNGFSFQAHLIIEQLKKGSSYKEIAVNCDFDEAGSYAFELKNIRAVSNYIFTLAKDKILD